MATLKFRGDRIMMETFLRAGLRIAEYDLEFADEFHKRAGRYFQKKIETFKARADSHPDAYWEQDVGGITGENWRLKNSASWKFSRK